MRSSTLLASDSARLKFALPALVWNTHALFVSRSFSDGDWQALPAKVRAELRIFARSRPIQRGLVAFRADLAPGTRRALERVMLGLDEDEAGRGALASAAGITRFERLSPRQRQDVLDWGRVLLPSRLH